MNGHVCSSSQARENEHCEDSGAVQDRVRGDQEANHLKEGGVLSDELL